MSEQQRFKSPPYPYLDLEAAVEKASRLADLAKGFSIPISTVARSWGYSPTSSSTIKVLGALNQFGLIDDEGIGEGKKYRLSELGDLIIRDKRPNSKDRSEALRRVALNPKVFLELWERFKSADVDVDTIVHELTLGRKQSGRSEYSAAAAEEIASRYRASLSYAGVQGPEVPNSLMSDDEEAERDAPNDPPPPPAHLSNPIVRSTRQTSVDHFEEKKALDEGEAVLVWPKELSQDSVEDMEYWLIGVLRQIKRRATKAG